MYIYFSIIKEKLNFLLSNMYLKKEKKTRFELKIFKEVHWCRVIQWFLSIVQAKYYFPRQISVQGVSLCRRRDTFSWEILVHIEKRFEPGSCTKSRTKISQNKVSPSLYSLLFSRFHPSFHFLSLFRSWSPLCILKLDMLRIIRKLRFSNETSCRTCTFWKEQKKGLPCSRLVDS